jgi:hypothetical protein
MSGYLQNILRRWFLAISAGFDSQTHFTWIELGGSSPLQTEAIARRTIVDVGWISDFLHYKPLLHTQHQVEIFTES